MYKIHFLQFLHLILLIQLIFFRLLQPTRCNQRVTRDRVISEQNKSSTVALFRLNIRQKETGPTPRHRSSLGLQKNHLASNNIHDLIKTSSNILQRHQICNNYFPVSSNSHQKEPFHHPVSRPNLDSKIASSIIKNLVKTSSNILQRHQILVKRILDVVKFSSNIFRSHYFFIKKSRSTATRLFWTWPPKIHLVS